MCEGYTTFERETERRREIKAKKQVHKVENEPCRLLTKTVCVARFTMDSDLDLKATLTSMGLGDLFNLATADFSRITSEYLLNKPVT